VTNNTQQAIYAWDTKASCSILGLEIQDGGTWQSSSQAQCAIKRAAAPVKIEPGAIYSATIRAGLLPQSNTEFTGGSYRLALSYGASPAEADTAATVVYSALLTITGGSSSDGGAVSVPTPMRTPSTR
jgi:hypothetical protein